MADVLDGSADQRLLDHIAGCDACRDARHDAERARALVEKAGADFAVPAVSARLGAALAERGRVACPEPSRRHPRDPDPRLAPPDRSRRRARGGRGGGADWRVSHAPSDAGLSVTAGAGRSRGVARRRRRWAHPLRRRRPRLRAPIGEGQDSPARACAPTGPGRTSSSRTDRGSPSIGPPRSSLATGGGPRSCAAPSPQRRPPPRVRRASTCRKGAPGAGNEVRVASRRGRRSISAGAQ
jgi:hypothetical protein